MRYDPANRMRKGNSIRFGATKNRRPMATAIMTNSKQISQTRGENSSLAATRERSVSSETDIPPLLSRHLDDSHPLHLPHEVEDPRDVKRVLDPAAPADVGHGPSPFRTEGHMPKEGSLRLC